MSMQESTRSQGSQKEMDRLLLARYAPASVVIDAEMEILQFRGETSPYLQPAAGTASFNLFKMVHADLGLALRTAISQARKSGQPVKQGGIQMKDQSVLREVQVEVIPLQAAGALVILFEEMPSASGLPTQAVTPPSQHAASSARDRRIEYLENEVTTTREAMQRVIEEMEATNEELQSANEELRSLNEELETSKEEIQASNEELLVVNAELQQRNAQLQEARDFADAVVETIREPLLILDADLHIQRANPAFYQHFQVEPAKTERRHIFEIGEGQWNIPALRTLLEDLLPSNRSFVDYQVEHLFPTIGHKIMLLNAQRIDHVQLILLALEDITQRKQLEREQEQMLAQRTEFMAIASHELKTPVTSLKGYTQFLLARFTKAGDEHSTTMLAKMNAQLGKLIRLINELLDVTKIEAGQFAWHPEPFDLNVLVQEIVEAVGQTTEQHQIRMEGMLPLLAFGDREHIGQVLTNLLTNALKYSPQANAIVVRLTTGTESATISVQDFGIGIAPEKHERVFERFFRVSDPEQASFPGLGLGLFISAQIVKRHGGRMWVESRVGVGSTFFFTIPLQASQEPGTRTKEGTEPYA